MILLEHYQELIFVRMLLSSVPLCSRSLCYENIHYILPFPFLTKRLINVLKCLSPRVVLLWSCVSVIGFSHFLRLEFKCLYSVRRSAPKVLHHAKTLRIMP